MREQSLSFLVCDSCDSYFSSLLLPKLLYYIFIYLFIYIKISGERGDGHNLNCHNCHKRIKSILLYKALQGEALRLAGEKPKGNRERVGTFPSFAYTQTAVRLYPNNRSPIPKFKRIQNLSSSYLCSNCLSTCHSLYISCFSFVIFLRKTSPNIWKFQK